MDWALHQSRIRFDIRAERKEYERLFQNPARTLQDRMARRGLTDRTKSHAIPPWEKIFQIEARERRLVWQARVLGWGKEKREYFACKES